MNLPSFQMTGRPVLKILVMVMSFALFFGLCIYFWRPSVSVDPSVAHFRIPDMDTTPGQAPTRQYQQSVEEASRERIEQAKEKGSSAMTTPLVKQEETSSPIPQNPAPSISPSPEKEVPKTEGMLLPQESISPVSSSRREQVEALGQLMQAQMQLHLEDWKPVPARVMTSPEKDKPAVLSPSSPREQSPSNLPDSKHPKDRTIEALMPGKVLYGYLLTEAHSDVPGPVLVKILSGELQGAMVMGHFKAGRESLMLEFQSLIYNGREQEIAAVAVDPSTSSFALATEVDHHYLEKVVWPVAAAFVSGFGDISRLPSTRSRFQGLSEMVETKPFSPRDKLAAAAGKGAETVGRLLEEQGRNLANTIIVAAGTEVGILLLKTPERKS